MDELQPTEAMIQAGIKELLENLPGLEDDVNDDLLQDVIVYIWQAMHGAK